MNIIPQRLRDSRFKFVKLPKRSKAIHDKGWTADYYGDAWDDPELKAHLKAGGNYGIKTGCQPDPESPLRLIVLDADTIEFAKLCQDTLPPTFTARSGSGKGMHFYYFSDIDKKIILVNGKAEHVGEIQTKGQMIVAPGSIHPDGGKYELISDIPIFEIASDELCARLVDYIPLKEVQAPDRRISAQETPLLDEIRRKTNLIHLVHELFGLDVTHPTDCPTGHDSDSHKCCCAYSTPSGQERLKCFHCEGNWDVFDLWMLKHGCEFPEAKSSLAKKAGVSIEDIEPKADLSQIENAHMLCDALREDMSLKILESRSGDDRGAEKRIIRETRTELVNIILNKLHAIPVTDGENVQIYWFDGKVYQKDGKAYVKQMVQRTFGSYTSIALSKEIIAEISRIKFVFPHELHEDVPARYIPMNNGIYDFQENKLLPHSPEFLFFSTLPVDYDPEAKCPEIIKAITNAVPDEKERNTLIEFFGYSLWREMPFKRMIICLGSTDNGKSMIGNILRKLLGKGLTTNLTLQQLGNKEFLLYRLLGMLASINMECGATKIEDTAILRAATGGSDYVTANIKSKAPIDFIPKAKLLLGTNKAPQGLDDGTFSMMNRIIYINFPNTFYNPTEYARHKGDPKAFLKDPTLNNKVFAPTELSGLFNASIAALRHLLENGEFSKSPTSEESRREHMKASANVLIFIQNFLTDAPESAKIAKDEVFATYLGWVKESGCPNAESKTMLSRRIAEEFGQGAIRMAKCSMTHKNAYSGIMWKSLPKDASKISIQDRVITALTQNPRTEAELSKDFKEKDFLKYCDTIENMRTKRDLHEDKDKILRLIK